LPVNQVDYPTFGKGANRLLAIALGQEAQRRHRQIVVGVLKLRPACGGEEEHLGRTTTATGTSARCCAVTGLPVGEQGIQVTAHRSGTQAQRVGDLRSCHWTLFQ
jgi:hypothetical protein